MRSRIVIEGTEISITNLAERHLRLPLTACEAVLTDRISITNLAERHLRPSPWSERLTSQLPRDINHESSRKAFETSAYRIADTGADADINHESSRKAFETTLQFPSVPGLSPLISITNLAERHLRLSTSTVSRIVKSAEYQSRI